MKYLTSLVALIVAVPAFATPVEIVKRNSSTTEITHTGQVYRLYSSFQYINHFIRLRGSTLALGLAATLIRIATPSSPSAVKSTAREETAIKYQYIPALLKVNETDYILRSSGLK